MSRAAVVVAALTVVVGWSRPAGAQAVPCSVDERPTTRVEFFTLPSGNRNYFLGGGGITMRCPARGIVLVADSIESYGDEGRIFLIRNVRYVEPRLRVTADYITYYTVDERVLAVGNVVANLPSGSTLRGPQAEYRRASPRVRQLAELESVGRPTITIVPDQARATTDAGRRNQDTTKVTGYRVFMQGDSLLYASGQVVIDRPDFGATGDSVFMNTASQYMQLMRSPAIQGKGSRPFRLTGDLIDLYSRERALDRVVSRGQSRAVSDEMTLTSDTIQFQVAQDLLQAAFAWGRTRQAEAVSPTQRITADSIAVDMPAQRVRRLAALGKAYAEADPDTIQFRTKEKDWLRGDTIIARFDTLPMRLPTDTAGAAIDTAIPRQAGGRAPQDTTTQIRELLAVGDARSYQHLPPQNRNLRCAAINYVRGDSIRVTFDSGQVRTVRVINEAAAGVLAEPDSTCRPDTPAAPADSSPPSTVRPSPSTGMPIQRPAPRPTTPAPAEPRRASPTARPQPSRP